MSITGAIEGLGSIAGLVSKIIDQLDTPEKRARARREFLNELFAIIEKVKDADDIEAVREVIISFMSAVDSR